MGRFLHFTRVRPGRVRAGLAALLTFLCALLGVGVASGAGTGGLFYAPLHTLSVLDTSVNGDGVTNRVLSCPNSHPNATGGGAVISGDQSDLDLELKTSGPAADGESGGGEWHYEVNNSSGSSAQTTLDLVCAKGDFRYPSKHARIPPGDQATRFVTCPSGTRLAGGGVFAVGGDHSTEIGSSAPEGNGPKPDSWEATVNNGSTEPVFLTVRAVCAERGHYRVVHSGKKPLPDKSQASATARCPKGSHVSGGGVRITGLDNGLEVAGSAAFDNGDGNATPDDGWRGTANNDFSGRSEKMQVFAVCKT